MGCTPEEYDAMESAMKATQQRFDDHVKEMERRTWAAWPTTPPPDAHVQCGRMFTDGMINRSIDQTNNGDTIEVTDHGPASNKLTITINARTRDSIREWKEAAERAERSITTEGGTVAGAIEAFTAIREGYKPIELEDILHIHGSVPHFMGNPVESWDMVDKIEAVCRGHAITSRLSYHDVCGAMADILSKQVSYEAGNRISEAFKRLRHTTQVAKENAIFGGKVTARQARRSAQSNKFTYELKKSLNEQQKGK